MGSKLKEDTETILITPTSEKSVIDLKNVVHDIFIHMIEKNQVSSLRTTNELLETFGNGFNDMIRTRNNDNKSGSSNNQVLDTCALCFRVDYLIGGLKLSFKEDFYSLFEESRDLPKWAKKKGLKLIPHMYVANSKAFMKHSASSSYPLALICCFIMSENAVTI